MINRKLVKQLIVFFTIILTTFISTYFLMMGNIKSKQNELLKMLSSSIKISIEENYRLAKQEEETEEESLYYKLLSINEDFTNIPLSDITQDLLVNYRNKYALSDLTILSKDKNDDQIYIVYSTFPEEVGVSTERWGFWNTAFKQMYKLGTVKLPKGKTINNFWVGPKAYSYIHSKATGYKTYYKYAYYYNDKQKYIINATVSEASYSKSSTMNLNHLLDDYSEQIKSIEKVGVVSQKSLLEYYNKISGDPIEPIITYGNLHWEDFLSFDLSPSQFDDIKDIKYFDIKYKGEPYKLSIVPLIDDKYICTILNTSFFEYFSPTFIIHLIVISIIISAALSYFLRYELKTYDILLRNKQQRIKAIEKFKDAITNVPDFIFRCTKNNDGNIIVTFNEGRLIEPDKYVGMETNPRALDTLYDKPFVKAVTPYLHKAFNNEKVSFEYDHDNICYEVIVIPDIEKYNNNEATEIICFINDVTKYVRDIEKNSYMAYHDEVTGLNNRHKFNLDYDEFKRYDKFALLYTDLDEFKSINDMYGHNAGDYVLQQVSKRLNSSNNTRVYRIGGDEFLIILPFQQLKDCSKITKNIIHSVSKPIKLSTGEQVKVGISIGISVYPADGVDKEQLINYADQAMYHAKQEGKNTFFYYN
jgi:diguanylate cyclase (GGDEF)-like protein